MTAFGASRSHPAAMACVPMRLAPGEDLRRSLETALAQDTDAAVGAPASPKAAVPAFVLAGIGSLVDARLRFAGESDVSVVPGPLEILTLSGTVCADGAHLHMSVSNRQGEVRGGHVGYGNVVRTTAEVLLMPLADWLLTRDIDALTGFKELRVRRRESGDGA